VKLLMTTDAVGGVFTYCVQLAAGLASSGVRAVLASMGRPLSNQQRAEARAAGAEVVESDYRLEWMDDPWPDVELAGQWLLELERQHRPDVVHVNGFAHAALRWRAPVVLVAHSSVCSWWRAVLGESAPPRYDRYRAAVARGLATAHAVVAPTAAMLWALIEEYGPIARAHVIPNGVPLSLPPRHSKEPLVLSAGRVWDAAKNIAQLEQAAARIAWPVFVAGDTAGPDGRSAPISAGLRSLGLLPRAGLAHWMERAAIFALPARYEPFGLAILEAAAARCALVLGDIPSLRELWNGAALFVDPSDGRALADRLEALTRHPEQCAALGEIARARAEAFDAASMAARYLELYRALCARPPLTRLELRP
jgi:glycosyltransferase involved in cell wall biosynthesis